MAAYIFEQPCVLLTATTTRCSFRCVCRYHLTDLPSFVSGQHLVLFDPHARYLPGASAAQPGLRVNLQRGRLLQQFPDAFAPYMHFGCNMEVSSYPSPALRMQGRAPNHHPKQQCWPWL
jgi:sacsin